MAQDYIDFNMCDAAGQPSIFPLLALSCVAILLLSVVIRMIGKVTGNRKMELWSGNMMYDIITTFIIAGAFAALYTAFGSTAVGSGWALPIANITNNQPPYFHSSECLFGNAMSYLGSATQYTLAVAKLSIWAEGSMNNLISATKAEPTLLYGFGYYTSTLAQQPVYPSIVKAKGMLGSLMSVALMSSLTADTAQLFLMKMVLSPVMFSLLAFAVVLRPVPIFKYFSNSIIAVLISFMLVFPLVVTLEGMIFIVPEPSTVYDATDFKDEANKMTFMGGSWKEMISQSILTGLLAGTNPLDWKLDTGGSGLRVVCSGILCDSDSFKVLIDIYKLMEDAYRSFFISAFILSINTISIAAGSKAISTLMDEEESLMEMFVKVI